MFLGEIYFLPIHILPRRKKKAIAKLLKDGLDDIVDRAKQKTFWGKISVNLKKQNEIDPYLCHFYPVYSLVANLTNPYHKQMPEILSFTIDLTYIPEGEDDKVQVDLLLNPEPHEIFYAWKTFEESYKVLHLRRKMILWILKAYQGNIFHFDYISAKNNLICHEATLDKVVGWPQEKKEIGDYFTDLLNEEKLLHPFNLTVPKWFAKCSNQYLRDLGCDININCEKGKTLLHFAARFKDSKHLRSLLTKFPTVNILDFKGKSPLHEACSYGNFHTAELLLSSGADPNAPIPSSGVTCLMLAAMRKRANEKLVKLLLRFNALTDAEDINGMWAVDYARQVDKNSCLLKLLHPMMSQCF